MISASASVGVSAQVADSARVWDLAQVRDYARVGERVIVGRGAYIDSGVVIGADSKIQNYALVYAPAELGRGVFLGPGSILTNDKYPRAVTSDMVQKQPADWLPVKVVVRDGASIGAGAICVAPVTIGCWAMIAAGTVVLHDVPDHALVVGAPARQIGWVGRSGARLEADASSPSRLRCPLTGELYRRTHSGLALADGCSD